MLCETKDLHLLGNGCLNDVLERVLGMARAELARMAVVREGHFSSKWISIVYYMNIFVLQALYQLIYSIDISPCKTDDDSSETAREKLMWGSRGLSYLIFSA